MTREEIFAFFGIALWVLILEITTRAHRKREGDIGAFEND